VPRLAFAFRLLSYRLPFYDTYKFLRAAALSEASIEDLTGQIAAVKGNAACSSFLLFELTGFFF
jgi:hypothetical protein